MMAAASLPARSLPLVVLALLGGAWHGSCAHGTDRRLQQRPSGGRRPDGGASPVPTSAPPTDRQTAGAAPSCEDQCPDWPHRPGGLGDAALPKTRAAEPGACAGACGGGGAKRSCGCAGEEGQCAGLGPMTAPKAPEGLSATGGAKREVAKRGPAATCQLIGAGCPGAAATPPADDADAPSGRVGSGTDDSSNRSGFGQGQTPNPRSAAGRHAEDVLRSPFAFAVLLLGHASISSCTASTLLGPTRRLGLMAATDILRRGRDSLRCAARQAATAPGTEATALWGAAALASGRFLESCKCVCWHATVAGDRRGTSAAGLGDGSGAG